MELKNNLLSIFNSQDIVDSLSSYTLELLSIISLSLIIFLIHKLLKRTLLKGIEKIIKSTKVKWDDLLFEKGIFNKVIILVPWILGQITLPYFLSENANLYYVTLKIFQLGLLIQVSLIFNTMLTAFLSIYETTKFSLDIPLTGLVQIIKLIIYFFTAILFIAIVLDKPPLLLLSGLGALTAVLLLVFKDTILGFVAGVQLIGNRMISQDDRIEMRKYGADGVVIEVALTTVKVKNFDNTISTIPTYALITDSFRNWRGMKESGCRRIKRSILVNTRSIKFCDIQLLESLTDLNLIHDSVITLLNEFRNDEENKSRPSNKRRITNLGIFRRYIIQYLKHESRIKQDKSTIVRELQQTEKGIGIEIVAFYDGTDTQGYENVIADTFDHLLAIIHEFHLDYFQLPTDTNNSNHSKSQYIPIN